MPNTKRTYAPLSSAQEKEQARRRDLKRQEKLKRDREYSKKRREEIKLHPEKVKKEKEKQRQYDLKKREMKKLRHEKMDPKDIEAVIRRRARIFESLRNDQKWHPINKKPQSGNSATYRKRMEGQHTVVVKHVTRRGIVRRNKNREIL